MVKVSAAVVVHEMMERAFGLVTPEKFGARDWREPISAWVTSKQLCDAGVNIEDVKQAVEYFTATKPDVVPTTEFGTGRQGFIVRAVGYRRGPAGP